MAWVKLLGLARLQIDEVPTPCCFTPARATPCLNQADRFLMTSRTL